MQVVEMVKRCRGFVSASAMLRQVPVVILVVGVCMATVWLLLPMRLFDDPYSTVLLDRKGNLLSASIADDQQWRFPRPDSLPAKYQKAAICFEDKRFWNHPGVDPLAVMRAVWVNLKNREVISGASTITMQTVRLARRNRPRTFVEKCIEAILAIRLELRMSKRDILGLYATHAPYGGNVVGLTAASWRYFGRDPSTLSWAESAMLAVLPNSPALIHPGKNRSALWHKRNLLLGRLRDNGIIDSMTARLSMEEPLPPRPYPIPMTASHLLFRAKHEMPIADGHVMTTIDKDMQMRINEIIERHHNRLTGNGVYNAAALVLDINRNEVLAYVGNIADLEDETHGYQVDIINSPRSTGSILKPFLYAGMMHTGELLPDQLVPDIPTRLGGFAPQNYSKEFDGAVCASAALARSLNIPAVRQLNRYGVDRFYDLLSRMGMSTLFRSADNYGLSLILGGAEATLWDITAMYAGMVRSVTSYTRENDADTIYTAPFTKPHYHASLQSPPENTSAVYQSPLDAGSCYLTLQTLLEVTRPEEERAWHSFASAKKIAWKTGTSYGFRDGWAVGVTSRYAVGVWVGNADGHGRPELTGISAAAPLLFDIFSLLPSGQWLERPELDLREINVCSQSGYRSGPHCGKTKKAIVHHSGLRSPPCPYCRTIHCDAEGQWRVHSDCERVADMNNRSWFVLPPALEWYYKKRNADYRSLPPYRVDCRDRAVMDEPMNSLSLIYPRPEARVYVPRELSGKKGRVVFEAAHRNSECTIFWYLDQAYAGKTNDIHQFAFNPAPGSHVLTLVDENGNTVRCPFVVMDD
ncbi:MAG: penicillin-binding protein 1C [Chitinispirillaceae bacterium]